MNLKQGISQDADIILQPYGAFLSNRNALRFDVLNRAASSVLLFHVVPRSESELVDWAQAHGMEPNAALTMRTLLLDRGYIGTPISAPRISSISEMSILKATRAEVEITNRCNLRCEYCYAEANRSKIELSTDEWLAILSGMYDHGLRVLLVSGGEPFLYKGIMEILAWASQRMIIEINSNGRYISKSVARELSNLPIKSVQISLDSCTSEYHDRVRGNGSHAFAVAAIENLVAAKVPVVASAVVTSANRDQLNELRDFVHSLGAIFKGDPVTRSGYAKEIEDDRWKRDFAASPLDGVTEGSELGFEPICQSQVGFVAVSHTGMLKPCNMREAFFEPTRDSLTASYSDTWWNRFYGESQVAHTVTQAMTETTIAHEASDGLCGLQRIILATQKLARNANRSPSGPEPENDEAGSRSLITR